MSRILYTKVVISVEEYQLPIVKKSDYIWKRTANTFTTIVGPWLYQCRTTTYFSFNLSSNLPGTIIITINNSSSNDNIHEYFYGTSYVPMLHFNQLI